jgi:hypothetical protein
MANTYLNKTLGSGNTDKWTWSAWVKKHSNGSILPLFHADDGSSNYYTHISFHDTDQLFFQNRYANTNKGYKISTEVFRDNNAWYHVQFVWDSDNSTADDRQIIYVNGERITAFDTNVAVTADQNTTINDGYEHRIGRGGTGFNGSAYANVTLSHVHFADGQALAPTVFGETDSTTGEWKIKTSPSFTLGTNGFTILKDGNTITDQSSNSNNWTLGGGTLTNLVDNPSNVYCVFNPLIPQGLAYANGNLSATHNASSWKTAYGTIAMSGTGKYYFESKVSTLGSYQGVGIVDAEQISASASKFGAVSRGYGYKNDGSKTNNNSDASYGATYTTGDIIGCALDLTNGAIYFSKNGAWQNSATTGEIAAGTTTNAAYTSISSSYVYLPAVQIYGSGTNQFNAGNGIFGTTAVSSVQNPSSGDTSAKFEYTPPTGFQPITTKGLNA